MRRCPEALEEGLFDVLVVGGGILGACAAWDAATRGLSVALIDKGDFGGEASANNLKIVHGGLRYLRDADVRRVRDSVRERRFWLRVAPHLTEPLPVVIPAFRGVARGLPALRSAAWAHDLLSADRNKGVDGARHLPRSRSLTRREVAERIPELDGPDLTGGIMVHDGLMRSPERLVLEVVLAAASAGAVAVNHIAFLRGLWQDGRLDGVVARDQVGGGELRIRARTVVNAAGGAADEVASRLVEARGEEREPSADAWTNVVPGWSSAVNVVVEGKGHEDAFALPTGGSSVGRNLFVVPWLGRTLIGTGHAPLPAPDPESRGTAPTVPGPWKEDARREALDGFMEQVRSVLPEVDDDAVRLVHWGLLPTQRPTSASSVDLLPRHRIVDHGRQRVPGAFSAVAVKFTTARKAAQEVVDRLCRWLGHAASSGLTESALLPGTPPAGMTALRARAHHRYGGHVPAPVLDELVQTYGVRYEAVLSVRRDLRGDLERVTPDSAVVRAQLHFGARRELAALPEDLVWRRTALGPRGDATPAAVVEARKAFAPASEAPSSPAPVVDAEAPGPVESARNAS